MFSQSTHPPFCSFLPSLFISLLYNLSLSFLSFLSFVTFTRVTTGKRNQLEGKEHGKQLIHTLSIMPGHKYYKVNCCSVSFCTEVLKRYLSQTKGRNQNNQSEGAKAQSAIASLVPRLCCGTIVLCNCLKCNIVHTCVCYRT